MSFLLSFRCLPMRASGATRTLRVRLEAARMDPQISDLSRFACAKVMAFAIYWLQRFSYSILFPSFSLRLSPSLFQTKQFSFRLETETSEAGLEFWDHFCPGL